MILSKVHGNAQGKTGLDFLLFNKKYNVCFYGNGTPTCSLMARKDLFYKVGFFDTNLSRQEDIDFAIRVGFKGGHFIGIPEKVISQYFTIGKDKTQLKFFQLRDTFRMSSHLKLEAAAGLFFQLFLEFLN